MSTIKLHAFADNIKLASFRVDDLSMCTHWLLEALLFSADPLFCMTDTDREVTLLLSSSACEGAPKQVRIEDDTFTAVRVEEGDLGFDVAGLVDAIASPLAAANVPLIYVSAFSTDLFLVLASKLNDAKHALEKERFTFVDQPTSFERVADISNLVSVARPQESPSRITLSKLPFVLRMGRLCGPNARRRHAAALIQLCLYPVHADRFFSLTRIGNETSLFGEEEELRACFPALWEDTEETELSPLLWQCLLMCTQSRGHNESGVMAKFTRPLAQAAVSIFKVTTVTNDYSLIQTGELDHAISTLRQTFPNMDVVEEERGL